MKPWLRPILTRNYFLLCLFYTCVQNSNLQKIKIVIAGLSLSLFYSFFYSVKKEISWGKSFWMIIFLFRVFLLKPIWKQIKKVNFLFKKI